MPPLKLYGYSLLFADDDSYIFSIITILLRCIQVGVLVIPAILFLRPITKDIANIKDKYYNNVVSDINSTELLLLLELYNASSVFHIFWFLSFISTCISIVLEIFIFRISRRGLIIDVSNERKALPLLWMIKTGPLSILKFISLLVAMVVLSKIRTMCHLVAMKITMNNNSTISTNNNNTTMNDIVDDYTNVCTNNTIAFQWLRIIAWIEIISVFTIGIIYIHVGCNLMNHTRRCIHQHFLLKFVNCCYVNSVLTKKRIHGNANSKSKLLSCCSTYYCHWSSLLIRCFCSILSIGTCCILGGRGAVFSGDFTDAIMSLSDLFDTGRTHNTQNRASNRFSSNSNSNNTDIERNDDNNPYIGNQQEEEDDNDNAATQQQQQQQQRKLNNKPLIEVTTSDVVAALILVADEQRHQRLFKSCSLLQVNTLQSTHSFDTTGNINNHINTNTLEADDDNNNTNSKNQFRKSIDHSNDNDEIDNRYSRKDRNFQQQQEARRGKPSTTLTSDRQTMNLETSLRSNVESFSTLTDIVDDTREITIDGGCVERMNLGTGIYTGISTNDNSIVLDDYPRKGPIDEPTPCDGITLNSISIEQSDIEFGCINPSRNYIHVQNLLNGSMHDSLTSCETSVGIEHYQDNPYKHGNGDDAAMYKSNSYKIAVGNAMNICRGRFQGLTVISDNEDNDSIEQDVGQYVLNIRQDLVDDNTSNNFPTPSSTKIMEKLRNNSAVSIDKSVRLDPINNNKVTEHRRHSKEINISNNIIVQDDNDDCECIVDNSVIDLKQDSVIASKQVRINDDDVVENTAIQQEGDVQQQIQMMTIHTNVSSQSSLCESDISDDQIQYIRAVEECCVNFKAVHMDESDNHQQLLPRTGGTTNTTFHRALTLSDLPLLQDALRYMTISMAVYGSIMYLFRGRMHICCCPCVNLVTDSLLYSCKKHCKCDDNNRTAGSMNMDTNDMIYDCDFAIDGSVCCACDEVAILHMACDDVTLVYANFRSTVQNCPYSISIDQKGKAIVFAIQGTLSLEAAVTDINLSPSNILQALVNAGQTAEYPLYIDAAERYHSLSNEYCHSGILRNSMNIHRELHQNQKLHRLLLGDAPAYPSFKLVVTGHSLGAGVATMLSVLLEPIVQDRGIQMHCMCFSPPGCTVTKNLADKEYITTVVLGSDAFPRMSLDSIEILRNDTLEMIARAKISKHEILQKLFVNKKHQMNNIDLADNESNQLYCTRSAIPESSFRNDLQKFFAYQRKVKAYRDNSIGDAKLMVPGRRIIHLVNVEFLSKKASNMDVVHPPSPLLSPQHYKAIWANHNDFAEIQLTPSMISDHIPQNIVTQLENLIEHYLQLSTLELA